MDAIREGRRDSAIERTAPALVMWVDILGVRAGDVLEFRLVAPDGSIVVEAPQRVERTQARRFVYVGARRSAVRWPEGEYQGRITHRRSSRETEVSVSARIGAAADRGGTAGQK